MVEPSYRKLHKSGELKKRIEKLLGLLDSCTLCPRMCGVNRRDGETGYCNSSLELKIASAFPHFGEERPLVGRKGSGTIFLSHCNLLCTFCQNYDISHLGHGEKVTVSRFAQLMIALQNQGCHNINFVTPTHFVPQIISALPNAIKMGLNIPLVYNCGGYESIRVIKLLRGIIDIYMPDVKFSRDEEARKYAAASGYFEVVKNVLKEMHDQTGDLIENSDGIAVKGLLIRHLIMPNNVAGSDTILKFIADEISKHSYVNIMDQYRPCYKAGQDKLINRAITGTEYRAAVNAAKEYGLHRGF